MNTFDSERMMTKKHPHTGWQDAYEKYSFNLFRHLTFIEQYLLQQFMNQLQLYGYKGLNANFIQVIPYLGKDGLRAIDLAKQQQVPRQTMAKLVNEICQKKFIIKKPDPDDSRAKRLLISKRGIALIRDALRIAGEIEKPLFDMIGGEAFKEFKSNVDLAFRAMDLTYPPMNQHMAVSHPGKRNGLLIQLYGMTRVVDLELNRLNIEQGFDDMQNSFRTILGNLSENGTRIADITMVSKTTKQSVSLIARKTIECGYVNKVPDPFDQRSQKLVFSSRGRKLIINSMKNYAEIEQRLSDKIGHEAFDKLQFHAARLWQCLGGIGPEPISDDKSALNVDNNTIDDWIRVLYLALRGDNPDDLDTYFVHTKQGINLTPRLTQLLLKQSPLKITRKDEKRIHSWLNRMIKREDK
jgi:DNA-binding MarR family transcriptional regulator